ncbi:MAG: PLD nuclease N-terminal domain-containing protein [Nanoarchaeota archaeon]|nr:PLD nuclease N-terminal domain-containing protein [Nanoarchaeota archaeon]MBU1051872.1 PLD nuclease N-terminal domain-containing protein [Nanoarchaeota archaeon]MBU1988992.1 PLD nuclease N-terminal domain-containing protein [Nanoarchaeota archaeon]
MAAETFLIFWIIFLIFIIFAIAVLTMIFWIWMIVDCAQRNFKNENDKILWILVIVLAGIIGAIIYYFVVKHKDKK